jgi:1-acyl-sn-glycerol-3-phosphate acyltransferase
MPSSVEALTQINLDDLVASFGWGDRPILARLLRRAFHKPAQTFAKQMAEFDQATGARGLPDASRLTHRHYVRELHVFGRDRLPAGPFLALSNHPGMTDTLALFAALNRKDLKVIALQRPFLESIPNVSKQLFFVNDDPAARMSLVRAVSGHLRAGGAALTFPAGHIEPDPDVYPGAVESLQDWTDSVGVFIRLAPETAVVPVLVRGAVWKKYARHPLLAIKKTKDEKEKLAAALQLLAHVVFNANDVHMRVQIGRPVTVKELGTTETRLLHQAVLAEMKSLIESPPEGDGESEL